jgi:hypothetical protein
MEQVDLATWAKSAVTRYPKTREYFGLSYGDASRRAQAICVAAGESGQTINASAHLEKLVQAMHKRPSKVT